MKKLFKMLCCALMGLFTAGCATEGGSDYQKIKEEGEAFLRENAKKSGVTVTTSGLQYEVLKEGTGKQPTAASTVRCDYVGTFINGKTFDKGTDVEFPLNGVIRGWTEGLQLMKEGAKYRFYIPFQLGYGTFGAGGVIPPYAALIFEVTLLEVK